MTAEPLVDYRFARQEELNAWTRRPLFAWLTPRELDELGSWCDASRRAQWLAARALAKQLILQAFPIASPEALAIEISSLNDAGKGTRPKLTIAGREATCSLSISHTDGAVAAAISTSSYSIGIDLVRWDYSPRLGSEWFTAAERNDPRNVGSKTSVVWAAKEAFYKAINQGEPFEPDQIEIGTRSDGGLICRRYGQSVPPVCSLRVWKVSGHSIVLAIVDHVRAARPDNRATWKEVAHVS